MMTWTLQTWHRFVAWTSQTESPWSMALVRVAVSTVLLWDLLVVGMYGLPPILWGPKESGGVHDIYRFKRLPEVYWLLPQDMAEVWGGIFAWTLWAAILLAVMCFGIGLFTRFSGSLALLLYAQTAIISDISDRGIDRMIRIVFVILIISGSGAALSIDSWRKQGSFLGGKRQILAFPRILLVLQLGTMYFTAGLAKFAISWFPWGGYTALFLILQDPIFAVTDFSFLASPSLFWTTQVGTAVSHMWEITFPIAILALWYRETKDRPGKLRAIFNRLHVLSAYVIVGATFHIALAATLRLGIFPAAMLAMYPAFYSPRTWTKWLGRSDPNQEPAPSIQ